MPLKIQVLGKGLIPRGYGLAPRKDPFNADLTLIQTILATPGLIVNYVRPEDNKPVPLDRANLMRVWNKYNNPTNKQIAPGVSATTNTRPVVPVTKPISEPAPVPPVVKPIPTPVTTPVVETAPTVENNPADEEKATDASTESSDDVFKPINAPEDKTENKNSNNNNNYNKHNKHNR